MIKKILNEDSAKNLINAVKGHGKNPTWCNLEKILNQVKEDREITALLIDAYVMINIYNSLHDKVETNFIIDIQYYAKQSINNGIQYFFADHGYKKDESRAGDILKTIEEQCPEAAKFYCNWFRGYLFVAKGELKQANKFYKEAFEARCFAGCQFELFIKQAFALSCYLGFNADKVRDSADDNSKSKSPLSRNAKMFWNYGYAAGVFEQKAEFTHQIVFRRDENFKRYFNPKMFLDDSYFYMPSNNVMCIHDENALRNEYDKLTNLVKKDINKRIRVMGAHPTKNPPIIVALFYIDGCYSLGYNVLAEKFTGLVRDWLEKFDNLIFSLCSDKGCSIACDAIQQYKKLKLHKLELDLTELKQIVTTIIEKSDGKDLIKISLQGKRCALQEAIESCDIDMVKAVVEKIKDIDNLRISLDEDSPVYYAISRYVLLYRYMNDTNFKIQDGNINYNNLNVPGLTKEDKIHFLRMLETTPYFEVCQKQCIPDSYGNEVIFGAELTAIKDICLYLIEKTQDQDGYCKKTEDGNFVTSLLFAAESNNVEICRKLILHNADPNINRPYTFLHRCIYWESWDVLEMYLNEFPDKAKVGINDHLQEKSPLSTFLEKMENKYKEGECDYIMHIIDLFSKCGVC